MGIYEFSIVASGLDPRADDYERRFYGGRCDDATVSFQKGHTILDFAREAPSLADAVASAVEDVMAVGAEVDRVEPDPLVSLADIAARADMTRAATSNYALGERLEGFPKPVVRVTSKSPLWDWSSVARWLVHHDRLPRSALVEAEVVREANLFIAQGAGRDVGKLRTRLRECEAAA